MLPTLSGGGRRQVGFTLIELLAVIIILGILAATALPRYAALQTQARIAKLNGALGSVKGAVALSHAACLATQVAPFCTTAPYSLSMEGTPVTLIAQYPTADLGGIVGAAGLQVLTPADGFAISGGGNGEGAVLMIHVLGNDPANCYFTYTAALAGGGAVTRPPVYSALTTTGC